MDRGQNGGRTNVAFRESEPTRRSGKPHPNSSSHQPSASKRSQRSSASGAPDKTGDTKSRSKKPSATPPKPEATLKVFSRNGRIDVDPNVLAKQFEERAFDGKLFIQTHLGSLNQAGLETARQELDKFMKSVEQQVTDNSVENNEIYVFLCESVQTMEPHLQRLHSLLSNLHSLLAQMRALATSAHEGEAKAASANMSSFMGDSNHVQKRNRGGALNFNLDPPEMAPVLPVWRMYMEHLELALAERKLHKAFRLLSTAQDMLDGVLNSCVDADDVNSMLPLHLWIEQKEIVLEKSRREAITALQRAIMEPGTARTDLQQNVRLLSKLSTPLHAVNCLLSSHEQALEKHLSGLRAASSSDSDDFELLGAVSQRVFGCVGRAANDMTLIFKKQARELTSAFTVWSLRLTERCVKILLADVLVQFAAPLGLTTTMECILQMLVYCSCLEDTHRLCLQPHMFRVLWPHVESVVSSHVTGACGRIRTAAMKDITDMSTTGRCTFPPDNLPSCGSVLISEVTFLVDEMLCMDAIEVGKSMRQSTIALFRALCDGVFRGVKQVAQQNQGAIPDALGQHSESIMMSLSHVMEFRLPRATSPYTSKLGVLCVRAKMEPALHSVASVLGVEAVGEA